MDVHIIVIRPIEPNMHARWFGNSLEYHVSECLQMERLLRNAHIRACQSPLPVAKILPAGLRSVDITGQRLRSTDMIWFFYPPEFLCPWSTHCTVALWESQNCTLRSLDPETTHSPSCDTATDNT